MRSLAIKAKEVVLKKDRDVSTPSKSVQTSSSQPHWKRQKHQTYSIPYSFQRPLPYLSRSSFRGHINQEVIGEVLCLRPRLVVIVSILATLWGIVLNLIDLRSQWDLHLIRLYLINVCIRVLGRDLSLFRGFREVIHLRFQVLLVIIIHSQL